MKPLTVKRARSPIQERKRVGKGIDKAIGTRFLTIATLSRGLLLFWWVENESGHEGTHEAARPCFKGVRPQQLGSNN